MNTGRAMGRGWCVAALALANHHLARNDLKRAETFAREAVDVRRKLGGERSPEYATALAVLANILRESGDLLLTGPLYQQALDIYSSVYGAESLSVGEVIVSRAKMYLARGEFLPADADLVATFVDGLRCRVNVIPVNPGPDPAIRTPSAEVLSAFVARLAERGVVTLVRRPRGRDVGGACGQLAGARRRGLPIASDPAPRAVDP